MCTQAPVCVCEDLCVYLMWIHKARGLISHCCLRPVIWQSVLHCVIIASVTYTHEPPTRHAQSYILFRLGSVSPYEPYEIRGEMIHARTSQCCSSVWVFLYDLSPLEYNHIKYLVPHSHMTCLRAVFSWQKLRVKDTNIGGNKPNRTWLLLELQPSTPDKHGTFPDNYQFQMVFKWTVWKLPKRWISLSVWTYAEQEATKRLSASCSLRRKCPSQPCETAVPTKGLHVEHRWKAEAPLLWQWRTHQSLDKRITLVAV